MSAGEIDTVPLGRYHLWFVAGLIGIIVLFAVVRAAFNISLSGPSAISPFLAAMVASDRFVAREQRVPSDEERKRLTAGNLGIFILINALILLGLVAGGGLEIIVEEIGGTANSFVAIFLSLFAAMIVLNYLLIRWAYGGLARKRAEKLNPPD